MPQSSTESADDRIVVTGIGLTTCLGAGAEANWEMIRRGVSRLGPITRFELGDYPVRDGGEAPPAGEALPAGEPPPAGEAMKRWPPELGQLAAACLEAARGAGFDGGRFPEPSRAALVVGSSLAGSSTGESFFQEYLQRGPAGADYGLLEGYYLEGHLEALCRRFGVEGPSVLVSNACAAGATSLARGAGLLRAGRADVVLAAGFDPLSVFTFAGFGSLLALTRSRVRPFSRERDGMLLGDGYAAVVLETATAARRRGVKPLGLLAGWGESTDSHHLTHPHPEGSGAALAMQRALAVARISPGDIGYVNCHGTATRPNDAAEAKALRAVFGDHLGRMPISSSKPFFGHTLGAAGTVEAVVTLMALRRQYLPPTLNLGEPDPAVAAVDLVPEGRPARFGFAMSNSFGFGGANASLIFAREESGT